MTAAESSIVTTQAGDNYLLITMDDGKANALSFAMLDALYAALDEAEANEQVVIIAGRPGKFSAGFDLKVMGGGGADMLRLLQQGADLSERLLSFPMPVIFAVSGHSLAMGAVLCLSADYRIGMTGDFKIGLNEVAIGMTLPWFAVELAKARLAPQHLTQAVALAKVYDPNVAVAAGYLDEIVDPDRLVDRAIAVATSFGALHNTAHRETKARIREQLMDQIKAGRNRDFEGA